MSENTIVIASIRLGTSHKPTGATTHRLGDDTLPQPSELRIVQYGGDPGFLLLYLDSDSQEITDTYHDSLDGAFEQAKWEFNVAPTDWIIERSVK
jgi:tagatose-1,6-bisphosphate aldolase